MGGAFVEISSRTRAMLLYLIFFNPVQPVLLQCPFNALFFVTAALAITGNVSGNAYS